MSGLRHSPEQELTVPLLSLPFPCVYFQFLQLYKRIFSLPLFLQPLPFVFLDQCCDFLAGKHQPYTCYFQSVKQYYCPFFPKITLQSANNLVVVIHNSLGLSVKFSQPDVIVHRDLVNFHDFEGSIQRAFLMKSVRSFEPDSASSFSNQLFSQHSAVNYTLVSRALLNFLSVLVTFVFSICLILDLYFFSSGIATLEQMSPLFREVRRFPSDKIVFV